MTTNAPITQASRLQEFSEGATINLKGKLFTVESLGNPEEGRPHQLLGARGARYWMHAYLPKERSAPRERFYITAMLGDGAPLRAKNGQRLEAYIYGNLLSSAN